MLATFYHWTFFPERCKNSRPQIYLNTVFLTTCIALPQCYCMMKPSNRNTSFRINPQVETMSQSQHITTSNGLQNNLTKTYNKTWFRFKKGNQFHSSHLTHVMWRQTHLTVAMSFNNLETTQDEHASHIELRNIQPYKLSITMGEA